MEQQGFLTIFQYKYITLTHNDDAPAAQLWTDDDDDAQTHTKKHNISFEGFVRNF